MLLGLAAGERGELSVLNRVAIYPNCDFETTHLPKEICVGPKTFAVLDTSAMVVKAPIVQGSMNQPPVLQNSMPPTSNQHVSSKKDSSVPSETPSSTTPCNNNLLDVGANQDTEILAIAHAAAADSLSVIGGCQLLDVV